MPLYPALPNAAWISYVPTLTAITTSPTLGAASVAAGGYTRLSNRTVTGWAKIKFGTSGTAAGSGVYLVSLPITAVDVGATNNLRPIGSGFVFDNSAADMIFVIPYLEDTENGAKARLLLDIATNVNVASATPMAWAASDEIDICFTYEALV